MYTLVIVEDEYDIRKGIVEIINWEAIGFKIIAEAENGKEAVGIIEKMNPDVIITDIKMPFISGIELAHSIRTTNPTTKIIFLTGFDDLEYAKSAIKLNVFEYLTKPISAQMLTETMVHVKERIDGEIAYLQNIELLKETYNENIPAMKLAFLISLINNSKKVKNLNDKIEKYGINLKGSQNIIYCINIEKKSIAGSALETDDLELILISLRNIAKDTIKKYIQSEVFIYDENIIAILSDEEAVLNEFSYLQINEFLQIVEKHYKITAFVGASVVFDNLEDTTDAYNSSLSALHYRAISGENKIINIGDFEPNNQNSFIYNETKEQELLLLIKLGNVSDIEKYIDDIFIEMAEKKAAFSDCQLCIVEMFATISKSIKTLMPDYEINVVNNLKHIFELHKEESIEEIKSWFVNICQNLAGFMQIQRKNTSYSLAHEGLEYLKSNYHNPEISLKSVSAKLFISPSYFSSVFKKEAGEPFSDCLTRIRMEKAKELLLTTDLKINDISKKTGYTDPHYFSYCFKKYYGLSPNEIRQKNAIL